MSTTKRFTNAIGAPVADNTNIMTAGSRGPALLQDVWLIEKMAHFDREVIPERRMHAKGWGAYGTFTVTRDITRYTRAKIFSQIGKVTPMFARFSTVAARCRRRHPRHRPQVLYRGGQLGHRRQQYTRVLLPRPAAVSGPEPRRQAQPAHRPAQRRQQLGLLDACFPRHCTRSPSSCPIAASRRASATCICSGATPSR
jgi:hypothetical protein